jgi:hypothetical protein
MKFAFNFSQFVASDDKVSVIDIDIKNKENTISLSYRALLDSGASMSVMHERLAFLLGVDLSKTQKIEFQGIGDKSKLTGKLYIVELTIVQNKKQFSFDAPMVFSDSISPNSYGILGRQGFFDHFSEVCFNYPNDKFYLSV